jgi:hypothetical protein
VVAWLLHLGARRCRQSSDENNTGQRLTSTGNRERHVA